MTNSESDRLFTGSIPEVYERYLVPLIFEFYAADIAARLASRTSGRVLEVAAGTGVVTRQLASVLPDSVSIVATDLNQPMLDQASSIEMRRPVEWRQADAMQLPFPDGGFDVVVCQFGVMFFPDKARAFSEVHRVLKPGGVFLFNAWDRIETNEFPDAVTTSLEALFPDDPPRFLARIPYGYFDERAIEGDLSEGGFTQAPEVSVLTTRSIAGSARIPALAFCQGTTLRNEIEARDPALLDEATDVATAAIAERFGPGPVDGKIQARVVAVEK